MTRRTDFPAPLHVPVLAALAVLLLAAATVGLPTRHAEAATASTTATTAGAARATGATTPGTGEFEVVDGTIVDPDGRRFVPVGTNLNGPNSFFDVPTAGLSQLLAERWKFNTIRLVTCLPGGCHGGNAQVNNDLDAIVEEYTSRRMVVMVDYHQLGFGQTASAADIGTAVVFWRDIATRFKDNPYVWFNLFNEPEATYNDFLGQPGTAASRWRAQHQPVIDAIRAEGASNVIVIDDTQAGQGAADWWNGGTSPDADSGIISEGRNLVDPARRLVFSVHAYDAWGFPNDGNAACTNRYTDAQRDARFRSYVQRVVDRGFPLLVGELGFRPQDQLETGLSDHGERYGQQPPCGSTQRLAAETVYRVAPEFDLGIITWHGYAVVQEGPQGFELQGDPPTNLTRMGELHYGYARAVAEKFPAADEGGTETPAPDAKPTDTTEAAARPTTPGADGDDVGRVALIVAIAAAIVAAFAAGMLVARRQDRRRT